MAAPPISNSEVGVVVNVKGTEEFEKRWRDVGSRLRAGTRAMLMELGSVVADAASASAPRRSGRLARSMMVAPRTGLGYKSDLTERVIVRPKTSRRFVYPVVVEFGSQNSQTPVKTHKRRLPNVSYGRTSKRKSGPRSVQVAAYSRRLTMKSQPFLGSTFARMQPQIQKAIEDGLGIMAKRATEGV